MPELLVDGDDLQSFLVTGMATSGFAAHSCSVCGVDDIRGRTVHRCPDCDFDVCQACRTGRDEYKCDAAHPLQEMRIGVSGVAEKVVTVTVVTVTGARGAERSPGLRLLGELLEERRAEDACDCHPPMGHWCDAYDECGGLRLNGYGDTGYWYGITLTDYNECTHTWRAAVDDGRHWPNVYKQYVRVKSLVGLAALDASAAIGGCVVAGPRQRRTMPFAWRAVRDGAAAATVAAAPRALMGP
eukprot:gene12624-46586_t